MNESSVSGKRNQEWNRVLEELGHRIRPFPMAEKLWWKYLTDRQRSKLGGNLDEAYRQCRGTIGIWMKLHGISREDAVLEVGGLFQLISEDDIEYWSKEIAARHGFDGTRVQAAVDTGDLVLVKRVSPAAYWARKQIGIEWETYRALWDFLWHLAVASRRGRWLVETDVGESVTWSALKHRKDHLINDHPFPGRLADLIKTRRGQDHGYRFDSVRIHLFQVGRKGRIEELSSGL